MSKAKPEAKLREFNADDARVIARSVIESAAGRACAWSPAAVETVAAVILRGAVNMARVVEAAPRLEEPGDRSFVVLDAKGELAAISGRSRCKRGKGNVKTFNPFAVLVPDLANSDGWNPLADKGRKR
jgi:hypothetical protein